MSTEIAPFDQQASPAEIRERVTAYLQKLEDPAKGKEFLDYVKASKRIGWLVQNAARKREIYAAEIFTCWKIAKLLDGKIVKGRPKSGTDDSTFPWGKIGVDRHQGQKWIRLHNAFTWDELQAEIDKLDEKPTLTAILARIPSETILIVPKPGRYAVIYADPPWRYNFAQFQDLRIRYPTLTVEQIIDYAVAGKLLRSEYFDKDAVLFLWATPPKLVEALTVLFDTQNTSSIYYEPAI